MKLEVATQLQLKVLLRISSQYRRVKLQNSQELLGEIKLRVLALFSLKLGRMDAAPAAAQPYRVLQMQHLVVHDVLDGALGYARMIEYLAYHNRVVRRIIVAKPVACSFRTPGHLWPCQQPVKKMAVQLVKDCIQIVDPALGLTNALAAPNLPHQVRLARHVLR